MRILAAIVAALWLAYLRDNPTEWWQKILIGVLVFYLFFYALFAKEKPKNTSTTIIKVVNIVITMPEEKDKKEP